MSNQTDCRRGWRPRLYPKSAAVLAAAEEIRKQKQRCLLSDPEIYDDIIALKYTDEGVYDDVIVNQHAEFVDTGDRPTEPAWLQSQPPKGGSTVPPDSDEEIYDDTVVQKPDITTPQTCGSAATRPQPSQKPSHLYDQGEVLEEAKGQAGQKDPQPESRGANLGSCFAREGQLQPELELHGTIWLNNSAVTKGQETLQAGESSGTVGQKGNSASPIYPQEYRYDTEHEATAMAASAWATPPPMPSTHRQHLLVRDAIRDPLPAVPPSDEDPFEIQTWDSEEEEDEDEDAYEEETNVVIKALNLPTTIRHRATRITPHERKKLTKKLKTLRERSQTLPSGSIRSRPSAEQMLEHREADSKEYESPPKGGKESSNDNSDDEVIPFGKSRIVFEMLLDASGIERVPSRCLHASTNEIAMTPEESLHTEEHEEYTEGAAMSTGVTQAKLHFVHHSNFQAQPKR